MQGQSAPPSPRGNIWWIAALILGLTLACYWPALRGGLLWDDDAHVTRSGLQPVSGLWQIWFNVGATQQYYPLLHSAFWIEHRLWGDLALGYHLANVLLHAAAAVLLVAVLRRLGVAGASLAGLLFAVHPVCVESVAWISEQKNTLSLVFYLLAALAYLRFDGERGRPGAARLYILASFLFVLALLTKSVTATLPAALLLVFWWQRGRMAWRDTWPLIPWFVAGISSGLFTALLERRLIGAEGAEYDLTLVQRFLLAGRVVWFYLGKLAWPSGLIFVYPRWDVRSAAAGWLVYLAAAVLLTAALWLLRRRSRGPLAAWLFFVGSLFPALGFFNVYPFIYSYVADHFQYLACMGPLALAAAAVTTVLGQAGRGRPFLAALCYGALAAGFGVLTWVHCTVFSDNQALYRATIARNPSCWLAHNNLGTILADIPGRLQEAISEFETALRASPHDPRTHRNLGFALAKIPGRLPEAISEYKESLRINPDDPEAHNDFGNALAKAPGRVPEAISEYEAALRIRPDYPEAHYNLGCVLGEVPGRLPDAIAELEAALRIKPDYPEAYNNLGIVLAKIPGRLPEAVSAYEAALRIRPDYPEAHYNLGIALANIPDRLPDAIAQLEATLRITPDDPDAHNSLGTALMRTPGRLPEAISEYEAALRINPDHPEAHYNLGCVLLGNPGRLPDAVAQFEAALRIKPDYAEAHYNLGIALARIPGRMPEAVAQFEAALQVRPDFEPARKMLERLRQ